MSGGSDKTVTQASSEPWKEAQPALKTGLADAKNIYKSGQGFQPYTGSTVVPFADQTMAGAGDIQNRALSSMSGPNAFNNAFDMYGGYVQNGLSGDQQGVADQWRNTASGSELNNTSSAFNDVLRRTQDDTRTGVDLSMSANGRYGSGGHTGVLADRLGGVTAQMLDANYGRELGRQDSARMNLANMGQQGITNQFGAAGALPGAYDAQNAPATDLMKVGSMYEDLAGRTMADNMRIFQETQQAPMRAVEWLNAIGSGAGSLGGSQSGSSQAPSPNPFVQVLGGGLGLNSLLGNPLGGIF